MENIVLTILSSSKALINNFILLSMETSLPIVQAKFLPGFKLK